MRVKAMTVIASVLAVAGLAASACSSSSAGSGGDTLTFAVVGPFSGDNQTFGAGQWNGVSLAIKEINAKGGIGGKQVKLEKLDDKCDPTEAANVASRVAPDNNIYAVFGHLCSSATLAALPVYARSGLSVISGSSTNPKISKAGYKNFSRNISTDDAQGQQLVQLAKTLGKSKLGIVYASDDYGQGLYSTAVPEAKKLGLDIVSAETFTPTTTTDYTATLTKIGGQKPDVLLLLGYYNDMGTLVSQINRTSLAGVQLVGAAGSAQPDFVKLGGAATKGTYFLSYYDPNSPLDANQTYVKDYGSAYPGQAPNEQAAYWYEIPFIVKSAIEDHGGTRGKLTQAIHQVVYKGPTGTTTFDGPGDVVGKVGVVSKVENDQITIDSDLTAKFSGK